MSEPPTATMSSQLPARRPSSASAAGSWRGSLRPATSHGTLTLSDPPADNVHTPPQASRQATLPRSISTSLILPGPSACRDANDAASSSPSSRLWQKVSRRVSAAQAFRNSRNVSSWYGGEPDRERDGVDDEGMSSWSLDRKERVPNQWAAFAELVESGERRGRSGGTDEHGERRRSRSRRTDQRSASRNAAAATPTSSAIHVASPAHSQVISSAALDQSTPSILLSSTSPGGGSRPHHVSFSDEPESLLDSSFDAIPGDDDPLSYTDAEATRLLDSDSNSETESECDDPLECREEGDGKVASRSGWIGALFGRARHAWDERGWEVTRLYKNIIKCSIAYLIASLFTFSPFLSGHLARWLPSHDPDRKVPISNLHMVATVATYFHPGRTAGSMIESNLFAVFAFVYALAMGLLSMAIAVALHESDMPVVSNVISVLVFLGLGMSFVGYAKVKVGKASFNTACSLIAVIVFTVVVKEGSSHLGHFSTDKIWQVSLTVFAGVLVSNLVNFLVWPQSACTNLQRDIKRNLGSFSTLLKVLTRTFLLDDPAEFHMRGDRIKKASDSHHSSFTSLKQNLAEAKMEAPFDRRMRSQISAHSRAVDSLNRLAQHLNGLRSSCSLQHDIVLAKSRASPQDAAEALVDTDSAARDSVHLRNVLEGKAHAFSDFLNSIGPHMRSLVFTCSRTLHALQGTFIYREAGRRRAEQDPDSFAPLSSDLAAALKRFQREQTVSVKRLYTVYPREELEARLSAATNGSSPFSSEKSPLDEEVFLIFYFVFLLEEFANELQVLVAELEAIRVMEVALAESKRRGLWARMRSALSERRRRRSSSTPAAKSVIVDWPSNRRHQLDTDQTPVAVTTKQRLLRFIWATGEFLRRSDTRFAIKAGLGSAVLALPAFLKQTRHLFTTYQGQWALVSFFVVLSPTVGQSNQLGVHRTLGTFFGAAVAYGAYTVFPDNNVALPILGFFLSIPCFYYIVARPRLASTARFVLLSYNLTALYSYNLRVVGVEVEQIALRRSISVTIGVVWASALNHLVWPVEARRELVHGISDLLFKLAWLYQRLVLLYSSRRDSDDVILPHPPRHAGDDLESTPLLSPRNPHEDEFQAMELELQVTLIQLEGFLAQTRMEPRLKGPFPVATYRRYLDCCQNILDKLHSMRCVTTRADWHTQVRRDFIIPVDAGGLRKEMVGNVLLYFWLLGSAFDLKTPLPPYLPPAEKSRQALVDAIRELPAVKRRAIRGSSEYLLYFAYALSMKDLIAQLEEMGRCAQKTFGVLGGSTDAFERQFRAHAASADPTPRASVVAS